MQSASAHSGDSNHAHTVHLVPSSARRSRARRKGALLHALQLPVLRARQAQACCQSARREIAAYKSLAAVPTLLSLRAASLLPIATLAVGGPRWHRHDKALERGRPTHHMAAREPSSVSRMTVCDGILIQWCSLAKWRPATKSWMCHCRSRKNSVFAGPRLRT